MRVMKTAASLAALVLCLGGVQGAQADDFYKGKTVTVLSPFGAGGGYGVLTTLISRHLGRHLSGKPGVVAQFMPGGGGIKMANHIYNVSPRDGTVIGLIYDGTPTNQLLYAEKGIKYKAEDFIPLGSLTAFDPGVIAVTRNAKANSIRDAQKMQVIIGAGGRGVNQFIIPNMLNRAIKTRFKIVLGYKGMSTIVVAMERGEVEGTLASYSIWEQVRPTWIKEGKIKFLVQMAMERDPRMKDVPLLQEITDNKTTRGVFTFLTLGRTMQKALVTPPRVPAARIAELRAAVKAMAHDKAFVSAATKARINVEWQGAERLEKLIRDTVNTGPAVVKATRDLTKG
jgi:tripartite-type tricarboxylate transporter receptor subunit TctC